MPISAAQLLILYSCVTGWRASLHRLACLAVTCLGTPLAYCGVIRSDVASEKPLIAFPHYGMEANFAPPAIAGIPT
jgi:hypothetical protein